MPARKLEPQLVRCLRLLEPLFGRVADGLSLSELSGALDVPASTMLRDLKAVADAGWVQKMDNGRWGITTKPAALARAYELALRGAMNRINDFDQQVQARAMRLTR